MKDEKKEELAPGDSSHRPSSSSGGSQGVGREQVGTERGGSMTQLEEQEPTLKCEFCPAEIKLADYGEHIRECHPEHDKTGAPYYRPPGVY